MTVGALVRPALWLAFPVVRDAAGSLWTTPRLRERYPAYLAAMHGLVCASVPLMQAAADSCADLPPGDRSADPLAEYFRSHIEEERGHDQWILDDLAVLGAGQPETLLGAAVREDIAALAGAQYYWIRHCHPGYLLGYIAVLEGCPPDAAVVGRLPELTGWPASAFRTLALHAALDPGHLTDLVGLLDVVPLSGAVAEGIARNAAYTAVRAARVLRHVTREATGMAAS